MRERILRFILPEAVRRWLDKNEDYGDGVFVFGPKAQIMDVQRKCGKLVNTIWYEQPAKFESTTEVAQDMVGHLLILLYMLDEQAHGLATSPVLGGSGQSFSTEDFAQAYEEIIDKIFSPLPEVPADG